MQNNLASRISRFNKSIVTFGYTSNLSLVEILCNLFAMQLVIAILLENTKFYFIDRDRSSKAHFQLSALAVHFLHVAEKIEVYKSCPKDV